MITITDNNSDNIATIDKGDIIETLTPWFEGAPQEITEAIASLEEAALRGDSTLELAAYLDITIS